MDGYEYLRLCKSARQRYKAELSRLSSDFINSNILFKKGDIVEIKNIFLTGKYIVDDISMIVDDDFDAVQDPSCFVHSISVEGRKLDANGRLSRYTNRFKASDVIKVV